jgi:hypothetical protein
MKLTNLKLYALGGLALSASFLSMLARTEIYKTGTSNFSARITGTSAVFDRYTGTLYVGTDGTNGGDSTLSLARAERTATSFTALAGNVPASLQATSAIDILNTGSVFTPSLMKGRSGATHLVSLSKTHSGQLLVVNLDNNLSFTEVPQGFVDFHNTTSSDDVSRILRDASGIPTAGITHIATNTMHIFARVLPGGVYPDAAQTSTGGGIAAVRFDSAALTFSIVQGNSGLTSTRVDQLIQPARISFLRTFSIQDMHYNRHLDRLYVAAHVESEGYGVAGYGGFALLKGYIDTNGTLTFNAFRQVTGGATPLTTLYPVIQPAAGSGQGIFAVQNAAAASNLTSTIFKVRSMKTTTGLHYLIVNGGSSSVQAPQGNNFYSLRLSTSGTGPISVGDIIRHDRLAETALPSNFYGIDNIISATVGAMPAPWDSLTTCSDMRVLGDAVYIAGDFPDRSATKDPGVFCSHALFDLEGKIVAWTPWERVIPSRSPFNDGASFVDVDATNGRLWRGERGNGLGSTSGTAVSRTSWTTTNTTSTSLQARLTSDLAAGTLCVLDLPKSTPGIGATSNTDNSLALFGGVTTAGDGTVVFARTSSGNANAPTTDYSTGNNTNYRVVSTGLSGAGPVRALGYSYRATAGHNSYFFAGGNKGLFAFSSPTYATSAGFDGSIGLTDLNSAPFTSATSLWAPIASSTVFTSTSYGITHIVTGSADKVYILGLGLSEADGVINDRLFEMDLPYGTTAANPVTCAQSGRSGLRANAVFTGCAIITTTRSERNNEGDAAGQTFVGVLSTHDGIFSTTCDLRFLDKTLPATTTVGTGDWEFVLSTSELSHRSISRIKDARMPDRNQLRTTDFRFVVKADDPTANLSTFGKSRLGQAGLNMGATNINSKTGLGTGVVAVQPKPTNNSPTAGLRSFWQSEGGTVIPVSNHVLVLYTDDGRRFYTVFLPDNAPANSNSTNWHPHDHVEYNLTAVAVDGDIPTTSILHWIANISGTGQVLAGTSTGVIALD